MADDNEMDIEKKSPSSSSSCSKTSSSEEGDIYEVEKIIGLSRAKGKTLYKVRWMGYDESWDTWEPKENLGSCINLIDEYVVQETTKKKVNVSKQTKAVSKMDQVDDSSQDTVIGVGGQSPTSSTCSSSSRKSAEKKKLWKYVSSSDDEADTLKDKFWRDLDHGKVSFSSDMYSTVKGEGTRKSRPESFKDMYKNPPLVQEVDSITKKRSSTDRKSVERRKSTDSRSSHDGSISSSACSDKIMYATDRSKVKKVKKQESEDIKGKPTKRASSSSVEHCNSIKNVKLEVTEVSTDGTKKLNKKSKVASSPPLVKSPTHSVTVFRDGVVDTLKDTFFRDLEEGKINVLSGVDMYSRVKDGMGRAARPQSFSEMFKTQPLVQSDESPTKEIPIKSKETIIKSKETSIKSKETPIKSNDTKKSHKLEEKQPASKPINSRTKSKNNKKSKELSNKIRTLSESSTTSTYKDSDAESLISIASTISTRSATNISTRLRVQTNQQKDSASQVKNSKAEIQDSKGINESLNLSLNSSLSTSQSDSEVVSKVEDSIPPLSIIEVKAKKKKKYSEVKYSPEVKDNTPPVLTLNKDMVNVVVFGTKNKNVNLQTWEVKDPKLFKCKVVLKRLLNPHLYQVGSPVIAHKHDILDIATCANIMSTPKTQRSHQKQVECKVSITKDTVSDISQSQLQSNTKKQVLVESKLFKRRPFKKSTENNVKGNVWDNSVSVEKEDSSDGAVLEATSSKPDSIVATIDVIAAQDVAEVPEKSAKETPEKSAKKMGTPDSTRKRKLKESLSKTTESLNSAKKEKLSSKSSKDNSTAFSPQSPVESGELGTLKLEEFVMDFASTNTEETGHKNGSTCSFSGSNSSSFINLQQQSSLLSMTQVVQHERKDSSHHHHVEEMTSPMGSPQHGPHSNYSIQSYDSGVDISASEPPMSPIKLGIVSKSPATDIPTTSSAGLAAFGEQGEKLDFIDFDLAEIEPSLHLSALPSKVETTSELTTAEFRHAVKKNQFAKVKTALNRRSYDLEQADGSGVTLAMICAINGSDDMLELIVRNGANINAETKNGTTALMMACEQGLRCTVELILGLGAFLNRSTHNSGETALVKCIKRGHVAIVKTLLNAGCNFHSPTSLDHSAMKYASAFNQKEIQDILEAHLERVNVEFTAQVKLTLNNTAKLQTALFPVQCVALRENEKFKFTFKHELQPTKQGIGMLLFVAHARVSETEAKCRFYGPCAVTSAVLNGTRLHPLTEEGNFVMSFCPLHNGRNDLEIQTVSAPSSRAKLIIGAYQAKLTI